MKICVEAILDCSFLSVFNFACKVSTESLHCLYACDQFSVRPSCDSIFFTFSKSFAHLVSSVFISFGALFRPLNSARKPEIVSSPFSRLRIALSIGLNCLLKFFVIFDASALSDLYALATSSIVEVPFFNPANFVSKSERGVVRPLRISLLVDLNCDNFAV